LTSAGFVLGPATCQVCHQHVWFNGHVWVEEAPVTARRGYKHRCPRFLEDPELGRLRLCRRCREYWPDDGEFWLVNVKGRKVCRACRREWTRLQHEKRRPAA
jgi:hypothetical protein